MTGNINVQFLLGDNDNGTFEGTYNITFGVYPSPNMEVSEALWKDKRWDAVKVVETESKTKTQ